MSTRQEQDSTTKTDQISAAGNLSHIDFLANELQEFLRPGGMMLITGQETQDIHFVKSAQHFLNLKKLQLTSSLVKLQLQEIQEKEKYLLSATAESTSTQSTTSEKPDGNTTLSKDSSEEQLSTSPSKSAFPVGDYRMTKLSRESSEDQNKKSTG